MADNSDKTKDLLFQCSVSFIDKEHAVIAYNTLSVDAEPRKNIVKRTLEVQGNKLCAHWTAKEARILRVSVTSFFENLRLIIDTIDQFAIK